MSNALLRPLLGVVVGAILGLGFPWLFEHAFHLPWWLGCVTALAISVFLIHLSLNTPAEEDEDDEEQEREQIEATFARQQRQLRIARKKLARERRVNALRNGHSPRL